MAKKKTRARDAKIPLVYLPLAVIATALIVSIFALHFYPTDNKVTVTFGDVEVTVDGKQMRFYVENGLPYCSFTEYQGRNRGVCLSGLVAWQIGSYRVRYDVKIEELTQLDNERWRATINVRGVG